MRQGIILVMALFMLQPMVIGVWFALIPTVKDSLSLTKSELAICLLGMPIAVVVALQVAGPVTARFGVRRVMKLAFPIQVVGGLLPLLATGSVGLFLALMAFGASIAIFEVGMNVYAGRVEKASGEMIMNRCHGFWALGVMAGSLLAAAGAGLPPLYIMGLVGLASGGFGVWVLLRMPKIREDAEGRSPPRRRLSQLPMPLIAIGAFMLLVTLVEAAMTDWSAVYLAERLGLEGDDALARAGIAVTIFAGFMAAGRFAGDLLKRRLGALWLARASALTALIGLAFLILPFPAWVVYPGFALVGVGVAVGYPLGVSAISTLDDRYEAANMAVMTTVALLGYLLGPPVVGFLGEAFGMRTAFVALVPGLLACMFLAEWLASPESGRRKPEKTRRTS